MMRERFRRIVELSVVVLIEHFLKPPFLYSQ